MRYKVTRTPDHSMWVILDRKLWGFCTLPDDTSEKCPNLLPLEWKHREGADAWLERCYRAWQTGQVPAPEGWQPPPYEPSPWS